MTPHIAGLMAWSFVAGFIAGIFFVCIVIVRSMNDD